MQMYLYITSKKWRHLKFKIALLKSHKISKIYNNYKLLHSTVSNGRFPPLFFLILHTKWIYRCCTIYRLSLYINTHFLYRLMQNFRANFTCSNRIPCTPPETQNSCLSERVVHDEQNFFLFFKSLRPITWWSFWCSDWSFFWQWHIWGAARPTRNRRCTIAWIWL